MEIYLIGWIIGLSITLLVCAIYSTGRLNGMMEERRETDPLLDKGADAMDRAVTLIQEQRVEILELKLALEKTKTKKKK